MLLEGYIYKYALGLNEPQIVQYDVEVSDDNVPLLKMASEDNDSYADIDFEFDSAPEFSIEDPQEAQPSVPTEVTSKPTQEPTISKYAGSLFWNVIPPKNGIYGVQINCIVQDDNVMLVTTTIFDKNNKSAILENAAADTSWINYSTPYQYHWDLWNRGVKLAEELTKDKSNAKSLKLPKMVESTFTPDKEHTVTVYSNIKDDSINTLYNVKANASNIDMIQKRPATLAQSIQALQLYNEDDVHEYHKSIYMTVILPNLKLDILPKVAAEFRVDKNTKIQAVTYEMDDNYMLALDEYKLIDDAWVKVEKDPIINKYTSEKDRQAYINAFNKGKQYKEPNALIQNMHKWLPGGQKSDNDEGAPSVPSKFKKLYNLMGKGL